jgi:hypothetical protein
VPELEGYGFRKVIYRHYRIVYRIADGYDIEILAVVQGAREIIENRKSNATRVPAILTCDFGRFVVLALTSPFGKGGLRGISLGLKSPLAPLC